MVTGMGEKGLLPVRCKRKPDLEQGWLCVASQPRVGTSWCWAMQDALEVNRLEKQRLNKEVHTTLSYCPEMTMAVIVALLPLGTFLVFSDVDIMQNTGGTHIVLPCFTPRRAEPPKCL